MSSLARNGCVSAHNFAAMNVVVTGIGAVTPLGHSFEDISASLLSGKTAIREVTPDRYGRSGRHFMAKIDEIPCPPETLADEFNQMDRLEQACLSSAAQSLVNAGLWNNRSNMRIGIVAGIGGEHLKQWEIDFHDGGTQVFHLTRTGQSVVYRIRDSMQLCGPAVCVAAACASSGYAMAIARDWVRMGWVDVCLTGGGDIITPVSLAGFHNLRALSRRDDDPALVSRPFDRDRDGFVIGEGSAFMVLESERSARQRNATIFGEMAGVGMSSDASHMVIPSLEPTYAARAILSAMDDAGVTPADIDYINAHAAGTLVGDRAEAAAIRSAMNTEVGRIPVSSTKSMSGHLLSGAAVFEAIACLTAIAHQTVPPTLNLDHPDPQCDVLHVPHQSRPQRVRAAASNSFGFGGANLCVIFREVAKAA